MVGVDVGLGWLVLGFLREKYWRLADFG